MSAIWHLGIADVHAGSNYALIPPEQRSTLVTAKQGKPPKDEKLIGSFNARIQQHNTVAEAFWQAFQAICRDLPKCRYAYIVSDNIEGRQAKSGGAALVTTDTFSQCGMAINIINTVLRSAGNPKVYGVRGTPYHVTAEGGMECDDIIYTQLHNMQAWDDVGYVEAGGLIWKLQHFVSRSGTPYGKQTSLAKQIVYNSLAVSMHKEPDADILLFGHVHYCVGASFPMSKKQAVTLPCLKLRGESYGRQFNDFYDVGLLLGKQECEGAPVAWYPKKIKVAYEKPEVWK